MRMSFDQKLLTIFFDYLEQVIEIKQAIKAGDLDDRLAVTTNAEISYETKLVTYISQKLARHLGRLEHDIGQIYSAYEQKIFLQTKFILAALTDEIFLFQFKHDSELPWLDVLLERALFGTSNAGQKVFNNIDKLIEDHSGDATLIQLAKIYLIALHMGFKGRFRATENDAALDAYKTKLINFIGEDIPKINQFFDVQVALLDERESKRNRMRSLKPWFRIGAVMLLIYLTVSSAVWLTSIRVLNRIMLGMEL